MLYETSLGDSMLLSETMILWNSVREHKDLDGLENGPSIKVVHYRNSREIRAYDHLSNSVGACFLGWDTCKDTARAAYLFALMNQLVVKDGLHFDTVHKAFLEIDEYAEYNDPDASEDSRYENPFWKLHWDWAQA